MKAVTIILLAILTMVTAGCGRDEGVAATLHDRIYGTPPQVEAKAVDLVGPEVEAVADSKESEDIRSRLIGVNIALNPGSNKNSTSMVVTLSETHPGNAQQCFSRTFVGEFQNSTVGEWVKIGKLGHMICLDDKCDFMMLVAEKEDKNEVMLGAVPVILEDYGKKSSISSGEYLPTFTDSSSFMAFNRDMNVLCRNPEGAETYTVPILPDTFTGEPDYTYFPINDYSTWY